MPETVIGVDAYRRGNTVGWVAVALVDGAFDGAHLTDSFVELLETFGEAKVIAVDIPIGLPEETRRRADELARDRLAMVGRASSVFPTPPRAVVETEDYAAANALSRELLDRGLSRQSHALRPRIIEVERAIGGHDDVIEVHPELSFDELVQGRRLDRKKSWNGFVERRRCLREDGIEIPDNAGEAGSVPADDMLDACVAAWTARRKARGQALRYPEAGAETPADRDRHGRLMAIWY